MKRLPRFSGMPTLLAEHEAHRICLLLCALEMIERYKASVWLTGSALREEEPVDWDVRVIVSNALFDSKDSDYWIQESVKRMAEQRVLHKLQFDIRILPERLWYRVGAICLDSREATPAHTYTPLVVIEPEIDQSKEMIESQKDNPRFHLLLGGVFFMRGDKEMAMQAFGRALELDPELPAAWLNVGNIFYDRGDYKKAMTYYQAALLKDPKYAKAYTNLGNALAQTGMHKAALDFYQSSLKYDNKLAETHHNKATCLVNLGFFEEAEKSLRRAIELQPCDEKIFNTLGNLRSAQGLDYAAAAAYRLGIEINTKYATLYTNLANVYANMGRTDQAILNYERGLTLDPRSPGVRYNLALSYLRVGKYRLGWKAYEGRWGFRELAIKKREFKEPQWDGSELNGKSILIHAEQGLGDTFQFCRYVPFVARRGGIVYFEVQHGLQRIVATVDGVSKVFTRGKPLPKFDYQCPLLSMPAIFGTDIDTVPVKIPYIRAWHWEVDRAWERWPRSGYRIGISWAGNPKYKKDRERSFSLSEYAALADLGVEFYSLQKGPATRQIEKYRDMIKVIDASANALDFAESAALAETMDLVIASDSSPMHMAAAMGKEVWLLLCYLPDWRWMERGSTTPWYQNVRIFRQETPGDWGGVFAKVREALRRRLQNLRTTEVGNEQNNAASSIGD